MRDRLRRSVVAAIAAVAGMAVLAPAAGASIGTPSVTLSPSSAAAASTANQGVDINFSPSGDDSVKNLTLQLPPGLIANASIDGGACLKSATPLAACQVGSGSVTADVNVAPPLVAPPLTLSAEFTLVAPPAAGDLAGLDDYDHNARVEMPARGALRQERDGLHHDVCRILGLELDPILVDVHAV